MKILFVHQNFPGQFLHLAPELARLGHEVVALTDAKNSRKMAVTCYRYRHEVAGPDRAACRLGRSYTEYSDRGVSVARAARSLFERTGFVPDVIFGHSGWGETLFLKAVWPQARLIIYAEFFYQPDGADTGFDPEFSRGQDPLEQWILTTARRTHLGAAMLGADAALAPTQWQAGTFPPALRPMITVGFDGIDTARLSPDPMAQLVLPDGTLLRAGDEVVTFVNRNLEPYRGFHIFLRALPQVLAARPNARIVLAGGEGSSYGNPPADGGSWKAKFLAEMGGQLDLSRLHFTGPLPYGDFVRLMQISRVHAYLTYPFVLSWSMLEAMSAGALVIGSDTAPVREVIRDGVNGRLVDFFDVAAWSRALIAGLADPEGHLALRRAARQTVLDHYDLRRICLPRLVDFVTRTAAGQAAG